MFFVHALYLQPYLWPRTVPKRQEHNSGQQFTLYYDQLARGRFLFNFPKQKKGKKTPFCFDELQHHMASSGRLRASPSAPAYARSCARPAGIRFAPRSCVHRPELVVFTAGDDGNGRRQGHAGMHPRARGIYNDPSYRGGTRAAPVRLAMACYRPAALALFGSARILLRTFFEKRISHAWCSK